MIEVVSYLILISLMFVSFYGVFNSDTMRKLLFWTIFVFIQLIILLFTWIFYGVIWLVYWVSQGRIFSINMLLLITIISLGAYIILWEGYVLLSLRYKKERIYLRYKKEKV